MWNNIQVIVLSEKKNVPTCIHTVVYVNVDKMNVPQDAPATV